MADGTRKSRWYLAQIKPNSAAIAMRHLARQGFQVWLPCEDVTQKRGDRFVTRRRPFFPGYLFVRFDPDHGLWRSINGTQGVNKLVSHGATPAAVPDALMDDLMDRFTPEGVLRAASELHVGETVSVVQGPFAALLGKVIRLEADQRAWVLLDLLGGRQPVAISTAKLRA